MRWMVVDTLYPQFIQTIYAANPRLSREPYAHQLHELMTRRFGASDFYSRHLNAAGEDAVDVLVNVRAAQRQWARSHGHTRLSRMPATRAWDAAVLEAQVREIQPDIVLMLDMGYVHDEPLKRIAARVGALVGQVAFPIDFRRDFRAYRLVVSSLPHFVRRFRLLGIPSELLHLAFEPSILQEVPAVDQRELDLTFVGSLGIAHSTGTSLLQEVARQLPLKRWGPAGDTVGPHLDAAYQGEAWGLDMYAVLARSRVTLNRHLDVAGDFANNLRLFEATGMGACLLTEDKRNLSDLFIPGEEVVTYIDAEDCVRKARHLLADDELRRGIAVAGQMRTLRDHTYAHRTQSLLELVDVRVPSYGAPRRTFTEHLPSRVIRLPTAVKKRVHAKLADRLVSTSFRLAENHEGEHPLAAAWKSPTIATRQRSLVDRALSEMYAGRPGPEFLVAAAAVDATRLHRMSLLEIGCASGYYRAVLAHMAAAPIRYVGVDYSMSLLQQGRRYSADALFAAGDATSLPFADQAFDVALSAAVIMHVPDWQRALAETFRVSRSFIVLHRTPTTEGPTVLLEKKAYGVPVVEVVLGRHELAEAISDLGGEVCGRWHLSRSTVPDVGLTVDANTLLIRRGHT